mgnify:FL=1
MKTVIEFQDMNSFGQFIMKNEMLDRFFSEYFFVKNNGLIPTQLSFIRDRIEDLRYGDMYEKMVEECGKRLRCPKEQAISRVDRYMAELQYFLSVEYEENMELIDTRINSYYNLANTRIMQMASSVSDWRIFSAISWTVFPGFQKKSRMRRWKKWRNALVLSTRNTLVTNHSSRIDVSATKVRISH